MIAAYTAGLSPDQFWSMCYYDIGLYIQGYNMRIEHTQQLQAWHAANIMNMWRGKNSPVITPNRLLGKGKNAGDFGSPKEMKEYIKRKRGY